MYRYASKLSHAVCENSSAVHAEIICHALCRVLQPTKNPFMDTLRAVIQDVKWFLFLLILTVGGFTCAFYILFRKDQQYEVCFRLATGSCCSWLIKSIWS